MRKIMQQYGFGIFLTAAMSLTACGPVTFDELEEAPEKVYDELKIQNVMSLPTPDDANPEIVRMIPGTNDKAVFVSSSKKSITLINYTATSFSYGNTYFFFQNDSTAELTSIDVSPDGSTIAIMVAKANCSKGSVLFASLADGSVLKEVQVGYNPDSAAFSKDGKWLVVANEDDREDRSCKPADRRGGSISFIDLTAGYAQASQVQEVPIDHDLNSEPEGIKISPDNETVIIAVQETDEVGFFKLSEVPNASVKLLNIPKYNGNSAEPDGLAISDDGALGLVSNEKNGTFTLVDMINKTIYGSYGVENDSQIAAASGGNFFQSPPYNIDARASTKRTEPEECRLITKSGKTYALVVLQESHALIAFDVTDPSAPTFDSIAPTGIDYATDIGMKSSEVGGEGLAFNTSNGIAFVANERENSVTMLKSSWTDDSF
jgi:DNA-binding beta-propeller fold protein YncE